MNHRNMTGSRYILTLINRLTKNLIANITFFWFPPTLKNRKNASSVTTCIQHFTGSPKPLQYSEKKK